MAPGDRREDRGDARDLAALLGRELRPTPGRLGDSLRIVVVVRSTVAIAETFRIPDIATSANLVLFLTHREAVSTIQSALISGLPAILRPLYDALTLILIERAKDCQNRHPPGNHCSAPSNATVIVGPRQLSLRATFRTEQVQQGVRAEDLVGPLLLPLGEKRPGVLVPWSNSDGLRSRLTG